jgi:tetratricopeptide (TPR) repeat protein
MGQIKYAKKDYQGVIDLLTPIGAGNANYPYARYTLGLSYINAGNTDKAEAAFEDILAIKPSNSSEQEMKDVAAIKLGHINFGKPQLKKAAVYYASVSTVGSKSDEALLGLAWAFLKEQNFKGASEYAGAIITKNPNSLFVPEAHLLLGYCAFFGKDYNQALAELERAVDLANKKSASILELKRLRGGNPTAGSEFTAVQSEALKLSGQFPNDRVLKKQEKLRSRFEAVYGDVERYFDYQRDADKYERFLQDKERIVKDAKFAKATIINIKAGAGEKRAPSQQELKGLEVQ